VPILGTIIMMVRRRMAVSGQKMGMIIVLLCGAVLGTTIPVSAVPLTVASTTAATSTTTTSVFGWCAVLGGLCNPFSLFFSRPKAGRFCRGELRSPTGNNRPTDNYRPTRFLGIWGDFWVIWAHAMRPYGFLGGWAHAMRPYGFLGLFGRTRCAPTGFWAHQKAKTPASS
jgi:hypothetical protein